MGVFDRFRKKKITDPWDDAWLAEPHVYKSPEGAAFCAFALTEGTDTILPESPKYSAEGKELTDYRLVLVSTSKDGVIGQADFFSILPKLQPFITDSKDGKLLVRGLSLEEMENLLMPDMSEIRAAFEKNLKYISETEKDISVIERQFQKTETRFFLTIGTCDCPTGRIIVCDPLAYLPAAEFCPVLETEIPPGSYPVEISICRSDAIGIRICTVRMKVKDTPAAVYRLAEPASEKETFSGFPVDAGMTCICDAQTAEEYQEFLDHWHKEHPGGNHYDDYFADLFKQSEERLPQYQRQGGDFIEWENPDTKSRFVMAASGFGDGFYQSFWGYDSEDEVCELIIPLVNPDLFGL